MIPSAHALHTPRRDRLCLRGNNAPDRARRTCKGVSFMCHRIAFVFAVAVFAAVSSPASATQPQSRTGVVLRGPNGSWELCQSRRCLQLLQSLQPSAVRRTATPAKRQRGGYGDRSAYHRSHHHRPYDRPHDSGYDNADHYRNGTATAATRCSFRMAGPGIARATAKHGLKRR